MLSKKIQKEIYLKLKLIYKEQNVHNETDEIITVINKFNKRKNRKKIKVSEKLAMVICYGDSIIEKNKSQHLKTFKKFHRKYLENYFNAIHFLPFYPSSSDSGFSVIDHYKIDKRLGSWKDINNFSKKNIIMGDVVINHASARGLWFKNYLKNKSPGKNYFLTVNNKFNTKNVVRPREHKLLTKIKIFNKNDYLWRTFSPDQIDLNFRNPKVLLRFFKIMINLINHGVNIFRLDAVAYLWKKSGTKCVNLPETHNIIKFLRYVTEKLNTKTLLVSETNLPEPENRSYFGNLNESNWIYNFSFPPLLVHGFLFEDGSKLYKWSKQLPMANLGNSYLNFIASHDGIGMRPAEGILDKKTQEKLIKRLKKNGGEVSYRKVKGKGKKVYEANITLANAFKFTDLDLKGKYFYERFISAHAIMIAFEGIPAIYFNSIFGTSNDESKFIISGNKRDLNRYRWNKTRLEKLLKIKNSKQRILYNNIILLLNIRKKQKSFHPNARRYSVNLGSNFFAFKRISLNKKQTIFSITNMTSTYQTTKIGKNYLGWQNLLDSKLNYKDNQLLMSPFQTVWLKKK